MPEFAESWVRALEIWGYFVLVAIVAVGYLYAVMGDPWE
jgi:hypothetical protein